MATHPFEHEPRSDEPSPPSPSNQLEGQVGLEAELPPVWKDATGQHAALEGAALGMTTLAGPVEGSGLKPLGLTATLADLQVSKVIGGSALKLLFGFTAVVENWGSQNAVAAEQFRERATQAEKQVAVLNEQVKHSTSVQRTYDYLLMLGGAMIGSAFGNATTQSWGWALWPAMGVVLIAIAHNLRLQYERAKQ